jgi:predicted permease
MNALFADLHHALRRLRHAPGFSIATVLMLALGIGLSTAMVCTIDGVLLRGLPFPHGERLVKIDADNAKQGVTGAPLTPAEAEQLARGVDAFEAIGFFMWTGANVLDGGHAREIPMQIVSSGYFEALGMKPLLGRVPSADDIRQKRPLAVLSFTEWQRSFGGDPQVLGRRLDLIGDAPLEIIGVMPPEIAVLAGNTGVWSGLQDNLLPQDGPHRLQQRLLQAIGRLRADASLAQAGAALATQSTALRETHGLDAAWRLRAQPMLDLLVGDARAALWSALALALAVLLVACANVAVLVDARESARRREVAVLQAIGASERRLRRTRLFELLALALVAAIAGAALAVAGTGLLRELARGSVPRIDGIVVDARAFGAAVLLGLLVPAIAALNGSLRSRAAPAEAIRAGGKSIVGSGRPHRLLPAVAMGLSTVGLIAALGIGFGLWRLQHVDAGFRADGVHALQLFRESMNVDSGSEGPKNWLQFADRLQERFAALPGAEGVALSSAAPLSRIGAADADVEALGGTHIATVQAAVRRVSSGYRRLLDIPLLAGRDFDQDDRAGAESVAIVNRTLARRLFGDASALDRSISLPLGRSERTSARIVGVVEDIRNDGVRAAPAPEVLVAFAQHPRVAMTFLLRTRGDLPGIDAQMAAALWSEDAHQSITRSFALADELAEELRPARFFARITGAFALAALLLAVLGAYAVASLQQRRRIGEFGLRLAIGARPRTLAAAVLRDSLAISAIGVAAGFAVAAAALRLVDFGRIGIDSAAPPAALAVGAALMIAAAVAAALLPAWRAARIPPMQALRDD